MLKLATSSTSATNSDATNTINVNSTQEKINLLNFTRQQLRDFFISLGEKQIGRASCRERV